jgi:hypothetical protein
MKKKKFKEEENKRNDKTKQNQAKKERGTKTFF